MIVFPLCCSLHQEETLARSHQPAPAARWYSPQNEVRAVLKARLATFSGELGNDDDD